MVPPKKSRQPCSQLDSERLQELDDWLAKTELEYREEPPEHAAQLWKAGFLDNLPDHVVSFLRFSIPLFFGHLIGRGGGSLGEVWLSPLKINLPFTFTIHSGSVLKIIFSGLVNVAGVVTIKS